MAAIDVQITAIPTVEITHPNVFVGGVVTEQINGVTIGTSVSGSTNNEVIQNTLGTPVGTAANPSVVPDATVQLNGTTVGTIPSGDSDSFTVNLDGSPSGVWDGTAWQVTSTPCDDATVELNGVEMATIPSGDTENISIRQSSGATEVGSKQGVHWRIDDSSISINGSPVADVKAEDSLDIDVTQDGSPVGSWNGSAWIVPAAIAPSLSIEVYSDAGYTIPVASLAYGATAYIKVTPTGITPTSYTFFFGNGTKNAPQVTQVGDSLAWVITLTGTVTISATATDGTDATADATPFSLTSTLVIANSLKFDGVNDYATATPLIQQDSDFSITFWFKLNSLTGSQGLIGIYNELNTSKDALNLYYDTNYIKYLSNNSWSEAAQIPWTGDLNWHHFTFTYSASTGGQAIYIDGASLGVLPVQNIITRYFDKIAIGLVRAHVRYGNVTLADLGLHDSILNQSTITSMQTIGVASGSEVQRWVMDRPIGTTEGFIVDIINKQRMILRNMTTGFGIVADAP